MTSQQDQDYEIGTPNGDSEEPASPSAGHAFWRRAGLSKDIEAEPDATQAEPADGLADPDDAEAKAETDTDSDTEPQTERADDLAEPDDDVIVADPDDVIVTDPDDIIVAEPDDIVVAEVIDEEPTQSSGAADPAEVPADTSSVVDTGQPQAVDTGSAAAQQVADTGPIPVQQAAGTELGQEWRDIQAAFVDDPRGAVQLAAEATNAAMSDLIDSLRSRHDALSAGLGDSSGHRDTEQLRGELRRYRMLCQNLAEIEQRLAAPQPASAY